MKRKFYTGGGHGQPAELVEVDVKPERKRKTSSKKTEQTEQTNKEESKVMYKQSEIEPLFGIVCIDDKFRIVLGDNIISAKEFTNLDFAETYIASKPYELILNAAVLLFKFTQDNEKDTKKR